ncbi:MAG: DUF4136 domain-containing protein [Bacteroidetes bacterium]|nr:DUF4136 domain-containing protein [Bacteroidota bacterium]
MKRKSGMKLSIATAGLLLLVLNSCTKDPIKNLSDDESRIYITNYDSTIQFGAFKTFSISDSVAVISDGKLKEKTQTNADAALISAVKDNMQQRGYQLVDKNNNPDLGISVNKIISTQTGVMSYPSYWGYYNTFWDPYYWGYGGYDYYFPYSTYAVYQIKEGALSIDMVDLKDVNANKEIKGIWNGLIRGEAIFNSANAANQIKALFDQSPYLKSVN